MWYTSLAINSQMLENVIEDLFLVVKMSHNVPIELALQLESQLFDIRNVIADLNRWQIILVLLITILSWLGNQIPEYQLRLVIAGPSSPTRVGA